MTEMQKKAIVVGNSLALVLSKPVCALLGVDRNTLFSISIDQGTFMARPIGTTLRRVRRSTPSAAPYGIPPTRVLIDLMRSLDAWGMTKQHFQRLSYDGMALGEFSGVVSVGQRVDPVTVERLKMCLARRQTCKESWDATIDAVIAVRVREREDDGSDGDAA